MTNKIKFKKFGKLPGKPSELIRVAMKDLTAVEKLKSVNIDMGTWYKGGNLDCSVCFAGAVMRNTLKGKLLNRYSLSPYDFDKETNALQALNYFRCGEIKKGFEYLGLMKWYEHPPSGIPEKIWVQPYGGKGVVFKRSMKKLADMLESKGY